MASKLVDMGIKHKEMYPTEAVSTKSDKDYKNEVVHPKLHLSGEHARMMGAEDLKKGDRVRQTVEWVVGDHVKREESGKDPHYEMTLHMHKAGDQTECPDEGGAVDDGSGADDSPAMAFIQGKAKPAG